MIRPYTRITRLPSRTVEIAALPARNSSSTEVSVPSTHTRALFSPMRRNSTGADTHTAK
ncbi:Uncharacterised protein [Mycobacteroides abscessus subsp. abscessus]|nr:Uncharacterised protein [Mycobacteroides abscessus subsp. abscessus]